MSYIVTQTDVLNYLHNQMGHRVNPGGVYDDLKRYAQTAFDYAWRYYKWSFAMKTGTTLVDGVLPDDFDLLGYFSLAGTYTPVWDADLQKLVLDPAAAQTFSYQTAPPTLTDDTGAPFPSIMAIAMGAVIFAKQGDNPTRADTTQEWDQWHALLDRLVGQAASNTPRTPQNYLSRAGTFTGAV